MKIVHLVNDLGLGGASKVVVDLCKIFSSDHDITVVVLSQETKFANSSDWPKNVKVVSFKYQYDADYSLVRYFTLYFWRRITYNRSREIIKCIEGIQPDVLHCHLQPRELLIALSMRLNKTRFLFTDHSVRLKDGQYPSINTYFLSWIYRKIYSQFDVVAVSKSVFNSHVEFGQVNPNNIHLLIENRVDTSKFIPTTNLHSVIRIVYVARLEKRKGQDILIKAWAKLKTNQKTELMLVGGGDFERQLRTLAESLNFQHPIHFVGSVDDVVPYLQSAHIAVFPSLQEGLPLALLEKMACGLPVIASNIEEFQGIIVDRSNGLFFNTGDSNDLVAKLEILINDKKIREQLGDEARKFILRNGYDINALKVEYEKLYNLIAYDSLAAKPY
ncbi:MAG: glycosyltransferase family 4 protein [Cyclobacteriaceae bacterium]